MVQRLRTSVLVLIPAAALAAGCTSTSSDAPADTTPPAASVAAAPATPTAQPPAMPSPEEMARMMAEMRTPAAQHLALTATAGTWDADVSMYMEPGKPPVKSKGVARRRVLGDGLYVLEEFEGEFMGQPFRGFGVHGYSKDLGKYVGFWCDNLSTTPEFVWGTPDATGKVITYEGTELQCAMGPYTPRWVVRLIDADHTGFEHWSKSAMSGGEWVREVEIHSTRVK